MKNECIPCITREKWLEIAEGFLQRTQFPHCIGAIDGKHVRIIKPYHSGSLFHNYKNYFSIVLLAMADANYCFTFVDIGAYGKDSDSRVFQQSTLHAALREQRLEIPPTCRVPGCEGLIPYVIVGDEAFGLSNQIMRPYAGKGLLRKKRIFNYRLSRARRYMECTFGILANKWRIFHRPMDTSVEFSEDIVKACTVLHNYVRRRDGFQLTDTLSIPGLGNISTETEWHAGRGDAQRIRDALVTYFISDTGRVPWQDTYIL